MSELTGPTPRRVGEERAISASVAGSPAGSIESRESWIAASLVLGLLAISYGSPLLAVVGLKPITADLGTSREVVALAGALGWLGTGLGGIVMGQVAERLGVRVTVSFGAAMIAVGLLISASGSLTALLVGHALFVGFLGNGALYPPLIVYVSRWFDRRRGTALALISSGQYIAGMAWPTLFEHAMASYGWRATMAGFGAIVVVVVPLAAFFLQRPPTVAGEFDDDAHLRHRAVLGMRPNAVLAVLCVAGFCCCIPMAIPQGHLVAFCSDIGIPAAQGAAMLSVLQGSAFVSRVFWGWLADRVGGLKTVLAASSCQALAIALFLTTQDEHSLFAISAAYGLGFSGIIPAYIVAIRELFPSREAAWRVPTVLFVSMAGMAVGSWLAGALYDYFGYYAPAFATGVLFNLANLALVGFLVLRQRAAGGFRAALA
ncbi:MAG TPA: MFS transporter [Stellaceae bacterium]|nr:MFS transporter [Stellaceae bacterium]